MKPLLILTSVFQITIISCQIKTNDISNKAVDSSIIKKVPEFKSPLTIPKANKFDYPVGPPDSEGYYKAQNHGDINNSFGGNKHLGEDWNGLGGGNTDLGDTVFSIANGKVNYSDNAGPGWGNVVKITHLIESNDSLLYFESLYGHLESRFVQTDSILKIGDPIGTIGNANGAYWAHLHFEIRTGRCNDVGGGYSTQLPPNQLSPSDFINNNRIISTESE